MLQTEQESFHHVQVGEIIVYDEPGREKKAEVIQPFAIQVIKAHGRFLAAHHELPGYELGDTRERAIQEFLLLLVDEMDWLEINEQKLGKGPHQDLETLRKYLRWLNSHAECQPKEEEQAS